MENVLSTSRRREDERFPRGEAERQNISPVFIETTSPSETQGGAPSEIHTGSEIPTLELYEDFLPSSMSGLFEGSAEAEFGWHFGHGAGHWVGSG